MIQFINKNILHKLIIWGEGKFHKKKRLKTFVLLGNNQTISQCLAKRKKAPTEYNVKSFFFFFKKDSFAERRATICYSNYRIVDYKVFLVHPPGGWQKGTRQF